MTDKELRKLSRGELLEMILVLTRENDALRSRNEALEAQVQSRELQIAQSGSLAEAAVKLSGLFAAADEACRIYMENIQRRCRELEKQYEKKTL